MGVVLIKWAWLKNLRALCARLYLQPHHSKNPRSAPALNDDSKNDHNMLQLASLKTSIYGSF